MNRDDIIRMAREASSEDGSVVRDDGKTTVLYAAKTSRFLERFAALVAAAEREAIKTAYERLAMVHSATLHELMEVQQRTRAEAMPVNELLDEISELHDTVTALRDELMDMERSVFSDRAVMRQALEALEGVASAHGYEGGTPVEAIAALRQRLGGT